MDIWDFYVLLIGFVYTDEMGRVYVCVSIFVFLRERGEKKKERKEERKGKRGRR